MFQKRDLHNMRCFWNIVWTLNTLLLCLVTFFEQRNRTNVLRSCVLLRNITNSLWDLEAVLELEMWHLDYEMFQKCDVQNMTFKTWNGPEMWHSKHEIYRNTTFKPRNVSEKCKIQSMKCFRNVTCKTCSR